MRKPTMWFQNRSDTNRAAQAQMMGLARGFRKMRNCTIHVAKNKDADQLRSYCEADLRICFCIRNMLVFS